MWGLGGKFSYWNMQVKQLGKARFSENLVAEGSSCMLPSTCICNSPEFELGREQDLKWTSSGTKREKCQLLCQRSSCVR